MSLHRTLFYLLILLLPTQLGRHFWPSFSFTNGIRVDYLSPTIYLTDIIIALMLFSWLLEKLKIKSQKLKVESKVKSFKNNNFGLWTFLLIFTFSFLLLSAFSATVPQLAFIKLLKLSELFFLAVYIKKNISLSFYRSIVTLFSLTILYSSLLAWLQFFKQSSIGDVFWFLGERTFTVSAPGIAATIINGQMLLRPYSTFSHPNVLAGYLTILLPFLLFLFPQQKVKTNFIVGTNQLVFTPNLPKAKAPHTLPQASETIGQWQRIFLIILTLSTTFITFSRSAWLVTTLILLASVFYYATSFSLVKKNYRSKRWPYLDCYSIRVMSIFFFLVLLFLSPLLFSRFQSLTSPNSQSLQLRQELNQAAILMIKNHPLTGVGLNNFLVQLPNYRPLKTFQDLQPAHNIYLLIAAEAGLVGLGMFLVLIYFSYKKLFNGSIVQWLKLTIKPSSHRAMEPWRFTLLISLTSLLSLGFFDHYFFTLQQTQVLFAIILGLIFSKSKNS